MSLQCLGKLYSGTVYSGKQRNIYEHIYRLYSPNLLQTPLYKNILALRKFQGNISTLKTKYSGPSGSPEQGNISTTIHKKLQWSHLKHWK